MVDHYDQRNLHSSYAGWWCFVASSHWLWKAKRKCLFEEMSHLALKEDDEMTDKIDKQAEEKSFMSTFALLTTIVVALHLVAYLWLLLQATSKRKSINAAITPLKRCTKTHVITDNFVTVVYPVKHPN
jgi:cbb3-type cytochrome oxidase subunit 3